MTSSPPAFPPRLTPPASWWAALPVAAAGFALFHFFGNAVRGYIDSPSVFVWWIRQWLNPQSEGEHGWLLLALAIWVTWRNLRADANDREAVPDPRPAALALTAALLLHLAGFALQQTRVSIIGLLLFIWGVGRLGGGVRWGRALVFPLGLMVLALPWDFLEEPGFLLRLAAVNTTVALAQGVGLPVVQNGTQLFSADGAYHYDVAAACSGVRSLLALLALSSLLGYLRLRSTGRRGLIVLLCFPLTFVGNVVRLLAIILAAQWGGQRAGEWVHDYGGFLVFIVVLGGVQLTANWLARGEDAPRGSTATAGDRAARGRVATPRGLVMAAGVLVLLTLVTAVGTVALSRGGTEVRAGVRLTADGRAPITLPTFLGVDWGGREAEVTRVEREILPADTGYSRRTYVALDDARRTVFFSVVLSGRDRSSIHRPEVCLVGQGWTLQHRQGETWPDGRGGELPVTVLRVMREERDAAGQRREVTALLAYWFVGGDRAVAGTVERMAVDGWNRLRQRPDRWAYLVGQTVVGLDEGEDAPRARLQEVVAWVWPEIRARP